MCGIFGFLSQQPRSFESLQPQHFFNHRGPDDTGWLLANSDATLTGKAAIPCMKANVFFLHKRLAIIDLSQMGAQPMCCYLERYHIIFNGEIYNHVELRRELEHLGYQFKSNSDTEVLLYAYCEWRQQCLTKLIGMFAFAIFDKAQQSVFLARDQFAIKPLYYSYQQGEFIFASEINVLLKFVKPKLNPQAAFHYLRSGLTDYSEETMFQGIRQLNAGHYMEYVLKTDCLSPPQCYWQPSINSNNISFDEASAQLRTHFLANISLHLRSDVQVAATLSGGIDSSAIVACIRHLHPNKDINTYSYIADSALSEEKWIDIVNAQKNTISHKVFADPNNLAADLKQLIRVQDEPFGSSTIYAQHQVFKMAASKGVKVMLDGQGADEILGGYIFYLGARFATLLKKGQFGQLSQLLWQSRDYVKSSTLLRMFYYALPFKLQRPLHHLFKLSTPPWFNSAWLADNAITADPIKHGYGRSVLHEELQSTLTKTSLPMLLRYVDRNSMAYSIESRVPFLTTEIVDFIFSLPEDYLISKGGVSKSIFRSAMTGIVPDKILARRDKIGFATPEQNWLLQLHSWVDAILCSDFAKSLPLFRHESLQKSWNELKAGKRPFNLCYWRWLNFIKWAEINNVEVA